MTDITPSTALIQQEAVEFRAAVSESIGTALGAGVNYSIGQITSWPGTLKLVKQTFTGNGSWTAPTNLKGGQAFLLGCGGGGGGGGGDSGSSPVLGGIGGAGAGLVTLNVDVVVGTAYAVTIGNGGPGGAGGTGGGGAGAQGSGGQNSTFIGGSISVTFYGANGGPVTSSTLPLATPAGGGGIGMPNGRDGGNGTGSAGGAHGVAAGGKTGGGGGGGGAGFLTGAAGDGGNASNAGTGSAGGNASSYGAGGGGGGGGNGTGGAGGSGQSGEIIVCWFEAPF